MNSPEDDWDSFRRSVLASAAARMVVSAPVGTGLGTIVQELIQHQVLAGGVTVMVIPQLALLEQWRARLQDANLPVTALNGNSDLLLLLDRHHGKLPGTPNVLLLTTQLLVVRGEGPGLAALRPALLVLDSAGVAAHTKTAQAVQSLADRADRVVVMDHLGRQELPLAVDEAHYFSLHQAFARKQSQITLTLLEADDPAANLRAEAEMLLGDSPLLARDASLAELHSYISRRTATSDTDTDVPSANLDSTRLRKLNELLMRIEDQEDDPRAHAAQQLILRAQRQGRPCLITTSKVVDAEYVASKLRAAGLHVELLTGATDPGHRRATVESFREGGVLVTTRAMHQGWSLPPRTCHLLWSSPGREALWRDLSLAASSRDAELVTFDPSLPRDVETLLAQDAERAVDAPS